jgi:hypothetical protein
LVAAEFASPSFLAALSVGMLAYALLCSLIGIAWVKLVQLADHGGEFQMRNGLIFFARSQILKYLPTNLLHLVGRYSMARRAGASHTSLLFATAAETGLLIMAASTIAIVFAMPLFLRYVVGSLANYSATGAVLVALAAMMAASLYWLGRMELLKAKTAMMIAAVFSLYLCFFLLNGTLLLGLVTPSKGIELQRPLLIVGVAAAAWLAGFVVPGAPAGLGVREVILTSGLEIAGYGSMALTATVGYRIVTLGGDVIVALIGFATRAQSRETTIDLDIRF